MMEPVDRSAEEQQRVSGVPASTPIADHVLTRADGRRVAWCDWGNLDGPIVVLHHRNPGSRLFDPDSSATSRVRLITIDRPGYGRTDPLSDPTKKAIASDVVAVLDEIGAERVAIVGWSAGGHFAIEATASLGARVTSMSLVCTPAPDEEIAWFPDDFRPLMRSVAADPIGSLDRITDACSFYGENPDALAESDPSPADAMARADPRVAGALLAMMREGARQGAVGMASDMVAGSRGDALPLDQLGALPVHLWYGQADWIAPEHGRWYAERLPTAQLRVVDGAGHLLPLLRWDAILAAATA